MMLSRERKMSMDKKIQDLQKRILKRWDNGWCSIAEEEHERVFTFSEGYKRFLDRGKTERESAKEIIRLAKEKGFSPLEEAIEKKENLQPGQRLYSTYKDKMIALFVIGSEEITNGMNIIGSHIDAPRLDLKPNPLYEEQELAFFKTHYYGGVKKYQWTTIPLSLHGVLVKKNQDKVHIVIGEDPEDPVFYISDLLPHLAKDQMDKKMGEGITGEGLNLIVGSIPFREEELKEPVKFNIMRLLYEKYGIVEEDFSFAELEVVPAFKARDVGFDRSLLISYGQDDRVCAYTSLQGIFEVETPKEPLLFL